MTGSRIDACFQHRFWRPSGAPVKALRGGEMLPYSLCDLGYLAVRPGSRQVMVSPRIRTEFNNGREYYALV